MLLVCGCPSKKEAADDTPVPAALEVTPPGDDRVTVPAGWYTAGCPRVLERRDGRAEDGYWRDLCVEENPPRRVWVSEFEIDRFEATRAELRSCLEAGACDPLSPLLLPAGLLAPDFESALPARVTWHEAGRYCSWRGMRLPTEAEWEKAARGTDDRIFPWGDEPPTCERGVFQGDLLNGVELWCRPTLDNGERLDDIDRVGQHPSGQSPYGVHDMYGNAGEWTSDFLLTKAHRTRTGLEYERLERDGYTVLVFDWESEQFFWEDQDVVDPTGPEGDYVRRFAQDHEPSHVVKGKAAIASRDAFDRTWEDAQIAGIRCVRSLPGTKAPEIPPRPAGQFAPPFREPDAGSPEQSAGERARRL